MRFYLGTHEVSWLGRTEVPLFLSRIRLARQKSWPKALGPWALDSGGFSQLSKHGRWTITTQQYADETRRWRDVIGNLEWAASIDFMCEEQVLQKTKLTIPLHQTLTVQCYAQLREIAPEINWVPVIQGWTQDDYLRHVEEYASCGIYLEELPRVGVGTICRRQETLRAGLIIRELAHHYGIKIHGFGFKKEGLDAVADALVSADSLAWSDNARRNPTQRGTPDCKHKSCANCRPYALRWRQQLLDQLNDPEWVKHRELIRHMWTAPREHKLEEPKLTSDRQLDLWS